MKKTYKYETHVHTKEGSACASGTGQEMVRAHIEAGYSGMIVTDHFFLTEIQLFRLIFLGRAGLSCFVKGMKCGRGG